MILPSIAVPCVRYSIGSIICTFYKLKPWCMQAGTCLLYWSLFRSTILWSLGFSRPISRSPKNSSRDKSHIPPEPADKPILLPYCISDDEVHAGNKTHWFFWPIPLMPLISGSQCRSWRNTMLADAVPEEDLYETQESSQRQFDKWIWMQVLLEESSWINTSSYRAWDLGWKKKWGTYWK